MDNITDLTTEKLENSAFIKPIRLRYKQDGKPRIWDLIKCHDSVFVVIFNTTRQKLVFVKQFRAAVYFRHIGRMSNDELPPNTNVDTSSVPSSSGLTLELCAGIIDKSDRDPVDIAIDEVKEECGYKIGRENITLFKSCSGNVGIGGEIMHFFYAEVTDEMKVSSGGGLEEEGEMIETVEMTIEEVKKVTSEVSTLETTPTFMYGIMWFLANKK